MLLRLWQYAVVLLLDGIYESDFMIAVSSSSIENRKIHRLPIMLIDALFFS